jgi:hypothetical protein
MNREEEILKAIASEREACAAVCCDMIDAEYKTGKVDHNEMAWTQACAAAIRARGKYMSREAMKHTPGPWFSRYDDNGFYEIGSEAVSLRMAFTHGEGETDEANARLIAAAPDLLAALKAIMFRMQTDLEAGHGWAVVERDLARSAIAKATGEKA